jgi:hypothetical protein
MSTADGNSNRSRSAVSSAFALAFTFLICACVSRIPYPSKTPHRLRITNLFGCMIAVVGDRDGDGVREVVLGDPSSDRGGRDAGAVAMYDGRTLRCVWSREGGHADVQLGGLVAGAGDVDRDGCEDFAFTLRDVEEGDGSGEELTRLVVCSTKSGAPLFVFTRRRRVVGLDSLEDWIGLDPDPRAVDPSTAPKAAERDGASTFGESSTVESALRTAGLPLTAFTQGGGAANLGDRDHDSVPDFAVVNGRLVRFHSGRTGASLPGFPRLEAEPRNEYRVFAEPALDGQPETRLILGHAATEDAVVFRMISLPGGQELWNHPWGVERSPAELALEPMSVALTDLDHDGVTDWVLGLADDSIPCLPTELHMVSGATGALLWSRRIAERGFLCLRVWDDRNGDGVPELLVGLSDYLFEAYRGRVLVVDGANGAVLFEVE